jgi:putative peptidoglycan lipid II flippase
VIIWLAMPVATITFFSRGYLVNFIQNGGDPLMAGLLGTLVVAILFRSIYYIAARSFYAQQDTKTPLYISVFAIALNIILAIWFTTSLGMGAYGLAWAQSIVAFLEVMILFFVMSRRINGLFDMEFVHAVARMAGATVVMGVISYITVQIFQLGANDQSFLATFPKFTAIVVISFGSYVLLSRLLKLSEANPIIARFKLLLFGRTT